MYRKNVHLTFPPEISNNPVVCLLAQNFGVSFNILKAQINPGREGRMMLEITGPEDICGRALDFLSESGVTVASAAQRISREEESCMHCGMCTAMCPSKALRLDRQSRLLIFDPERCNVCGLCSRVCPVKAMHVEME
ncbi:MAG: 4Fe-4S binding protein [Deltaproteobacteria bacterium]|nr:4Fe-4S binding protein [Deltaproteobacteria bacterium]